MGTTGGQRMTRRCAIAGCNSPHEARGMCSKHYQRIKKRGELQLRVRPTGCLFVGCDQPHHAQGLCHCHYQWATRPLNAKFRHQTCAHDTCVRAPKRGYDFCQKHGVYRLPNTYSRHQAFLEEVNYFRDCGYTEPVIARRLGYTKFDSYQQYLRRAERNVQRRQQHQEVA